MTSSDSHLSMLHRMGQRGPLARAVGLLLVLVACLAVTVPLAWVFSGRDGVIAATGAVVICLLSGWLAIWATYTLAPPTQPTAHVLLGMLLRSGPPLAACLLAVQRFHWLVDAGFVWVLLLAYGVTLFYETLLTVVQLQPRTESVAR